jgi:hypothetical protein
MRVLVLLAVAALGCSDEPESNPPVASLKPGGSGWSCFRERIADISACERPADCEARRTGYATEAARNGVTVDLTACVGRSFAACFTAHIYVRGRPGYICTESMTDCQRMRAAAAKSAEYADVSDCGIW